MNKIIRKVLTKLRSEHAERRAIKHYAHHEYTKTRSVHNNAR